jgi:hypothetical protein
MARSNHSGPVVRLAFSPTKIATALSVDYRRTVLPAITAGELGPVYTNPRGKTQRRILVADIERWVRETWTAQTKPKRSQ